MSGAVKTLIVGFIGGTFGVALLLWCGVPYLAALLLVVLVCGIVGFRLGWQDRMRAQ